MKNQRIHGLSPVTVGLGVYIVVSASFMLQVNLWLTAKVGNPFLFRSFWVAALIVLTASIAYAFGMRLGALRILAVISVLALAYVLGLWQTYFEEKTHILMYGLLGFLAAMDLAGSAGTNKLKYITMAVSFVALVSAGDEIFQLILPYRFGDFKDFMTNVLGGALGIAMFLALKRRAGKFRIMGNP